MKLLDLLGLGRPVVGLYIDASFMQSQLASLLVPLWSGDHCTLLP